MTKLVIKLVAALIAALIGMPTAAAALPATPTAGSYIYDSQPHVAQPVTTASERGPPKTSYDLKTGAYAVDRWSHGASPRPEEFASGSTTAYTTPAGFARVARATGATEAGVQGDARALSALTRSDVAAKSADEVADIGHAGLRHQFPNTLKGKSQFYDNVDLGGLASRTKGMDGFLQANGNTRYVLRNPGGVGVDRTTGLPTDVFTAIRRPDGSVVTMFPGTSPKG